MPAIRKKGDVRGYIATRTVPTMFGEIRSIYCTNRQWYPESFVGPGGYCARVYKRLADLKRARLGSVDAKWIEE